MDSSEGFGVLFVCTGNICRSPAAELLLRAQLSASAPVLVASAGTHAMVGHGVDPPTASVLRELGVDPARHRGRQLDAELVARADLVLTAESGHRSIILRDSPLAFRKSFTMREFARLASGLAAGTEPDADWLRTRVGEVADQRGLVAAPEPGADEIHDPFGAGAEPARRTVQGVADAVDAICRTLAISR